jgi:hypothetical protein
MLKKLAVGLWIVVIAFASVSCVVICPEPDTTYRDYDAKGGYISEDGSQKYDWGIRYGLFDVSGNPVTSGTLKFYIKNYEDRLGEFTVVVNFWDENANFIESFDYQTISVGPGETEYGYISYKALWQHKPARADSFNVALDVPQIEEKVKTRN